MNRDDIFFDFHSLIGMRVFDATKEVRSALLSHFGHFYRENLHAEANEDIIIGEMDGATKGLLAPAQGKATARRWLVMDGRDNWIVFAYRGKEDIGLGLCDSIKIAYTGRPRCAGKLMNVIFLAIQISLLRKEGLLFHGALLCSGDRNVLLTGPSEAGKSIFVLGLLNDGWDYLSDDKLILHHGQAYLFRTYLSLSDHHFERYPFLKERHPRGANIMKGLAFRKRFRKMAERSLPAYLLQRLEKIYDPGYRIDPRKIFNGVKMIDRVKPDLAVVLSPGEGFNFTEVPREEAIKDIKTINLLDFTMLEEIGRQLELDGRSKALDIAGAVEKNLHPQTFFRMTVPLTMDWQTIYRKFRECLERVL